MFVTFPFFSSPPNDANGWEDYFENHFSYPSYHIGWDKTFEEKEELSDEGDITAIFDREDINHYSRVELDDSLHIASETLNNHFKDHGVLLNYN